MLEQDELDQFCKEIRKTGFPLEHQVMTAFKKAGWSTINSKYYLDDVQQVPREIDLIAYKASKIKHIEVYTTVIISCKKSADNAWVILSRKPDLKTPNTDWWPLHVWTNDKAIRYELDTSEKRRRYYEDVDLYGVRYVLSQPSSDIFAFQEMKTSSGKPENDKAIFSSINSLLQAQAYELGALPKRKQVPSLYQFNLLSVLDGEMAKLDFEGNSIDAKNANIERCLSRYIINKEQTFSNVLLLQKDKLDDIIKDYDRLHKANCKIFPEMYQKFFEWVLDDIQKKDLFIDDFRKMIYPRVLWAIEEWNSSLKAEDFDLWWNEKSAEPEVTITDLLISSAFLDKLNNSHDAKQIIRKAFSEVYHYRGSFSFSEGIPF